MEAPTKTDEGASATPRTTKGKSLAEPPAFRQDILRTGLGPHGIAYRRIFWFIVFRFNSKIPSQSALWTAFERQMTFAERWILQ